MKAAQKKGNIMSTIHKMAVEALNKAVAGKDLSRHAGVWDTLADFAREVGMEFPSAYRDSVLSAAAREARMGKGALRGATSRVGFTVAFGDAWKSVVDHADGDEGVKTARSAFVAVAAFARGTGAVKFTVEL